MPRSARLNVAGVDPKGWKCKLKYSECIIFLFLKRSFAFCAARGSNEENSVRSQHIFTNTMCNKSLVLGVLTVGLYSLVIKTTETAFFSTVKFRLGSREFLF